MDKYLKNRTLIRYTIFMTFFKKNLGVGRTLCKFHIGLPPPFKTPFYNYKE